VAGHCSTQRQARKLIRGPSPATKARLLFFNRTHPRVVTGLVTGHNTLRRHLYVVGLSNYPTCRKCDAEEETSVYILSVRPWLHWDMHIWVLSIWILRILRILIWVTSGTLVKEQGSFNLVSDYGAQRACFKA